MMLTYACNVGAGRRRRYASPRPQVNDDTYHDDSMSNSEDSPASSTLRPRGASTEPSITARSAHSFEFEISPQQEEYLYVLSFVFDQVVGLTV